MFGLTLIGYIITLVVCIYYTQSSEVELDRKDMLQTQEEFRVGNEYTNINRQKSFLSWIPVFILLILPLFYVIWFTKSMYELNPLIDSFFDAFILIGVACCCFGIVITIILLVTTKDPCPLILSVNGIFVYKKNKTHNILRNN